MKNILHFKADGIDGEKVEEQFEGIGNEAQKADKEIRKLGDAGKDSMRELLKFELVKQAIEGVKQAFSQVKDYVMGFVEDFASADLAVNKLRGGLERIGQASYFDVLIRQASQLSKVTPFDDDDITNMQSMLTTFDGISAQAVEKLTPAMLNLASAFAQGGDTGMNLTQVAVLIGKSAGAELWGALKKVGIVMTEVQQKMLETTSGMERINVFLEIMAQNGNITAEAFGKTLAGQLQIAKNEIGNISESLGEALAPAAMFVIEHIKSFAENLQKLPDAAKIAIVAIGAIAIAGMALAAVFSVLDVTTGGVLIYLGLLATGLAALITLIVSNIDRIEEYISENQTLMKLTSDLAYSFEELKAGLSQLWDEISEVIGNTKSLRQVIITLIETELRGLLAILNIVTKAFNFLIDVVTLAARGFGIFKDVVFYAVGAVVDKVQNGFNIIKNAIKSVMDFFNMGVPKTFSDSIGSIVDFAVSKINALKNAVKWIMGVGDWANTAEVEQTAETGTTATTWKAGQYLPTTTPKAPKEGKGGDKKDEDPYKEETKALKALMKEHEDYIKDIEKRIQLGELTPIALLEEIAAYKKAILEMQLVLEKAENKKEVDSKILDLRIQENKILNLNNDALKDTIALGKKIADDDKKKFAEKMKLEAKGYEELKDKRIANETDVYQKQIDTINAKWDKEDARINEVYAGIDVKEELLAETKKARMEELRNAEMNDTSSILNWTVQGFNAVQGTIQSGFANMWENVFGHANSLFEIFMQKVFEAFIALAATAVFKLIMSVLNPFGAVASAAMPTPGFAEGGFTGLGAAGEIAGIVHKNEFVVSSKGVNSSTLPLLEAMNSGQDISNFLQDTVRVPNISLPSINLEERSKGSAGVTELHVHVGGISVESKSILGSSKTELTKIVKEKFAPALSNFLRNTGQKIFTDNIKEK
ncbi:unnamed protein product [Rotaria sp. Silwood1]|nr:unnamed protein product [Rotaria sp. Silwood1]